MGRALHVFTVDKDKKPTCLSFAVTCGRRCQISIFSVDDTLQEMVEAAEDSTVKVRDLKSKALLWAGSLSYHMHCGQENVPWLALNGVLLYRKEISRMSEIRMGEFKPPSVSLFNLLANGSGHQASKDVDSDNGSREPYANALNVTETFDAELSTDIVLASVDTQLGDQLRAIKIERHKTLELSLQQKEMHIILVDLQLLCWNLQLKRKQMKIAKYQ